jgi:uncharacterized membrane protein YcaP (DUF421 family)
MVTVARTAGVYLFLLLIFRLAGKRTLAEVTIFDFILLLVISEATQQGLTGNDFSVTNACLIVLTLVAINRVSDWVAFRSTRASHLLNDEPMVLMLDGQMLRDRMREVKVREDDILEQGRQAAGVERLEDIAHAILERNGTISVIPASHQQEGGSSSGGHPRISERG